jgi:hypothetical protein
MKEAALRLLSLSFSGLQNSLPSAEKITKPKAVRTTRFITLGGIPMTVCSMCCCGVAHEWGVTVFLVGTFSSIDAKQKNLIFSHQVAHYGVGLRSKQHSYHIAKSVQDEVIIIIIIIIIIFTYPDRRICVVDIVVCRIAFIERRSTQH